jgi:uncharacterized protein YpmS
MKTNSLLQRTQSNDKVFQLSPIKLPINNFVDFYTKEVSEKISVWKGFFITQQVVHLEPMMLA